LNLSIKDFQRLQIKEKASDHLNTPCHFNRLGNKKSQRWQVKVSGKKFFTAKNSIERKKFLPGTRRA
jgi:hypothetical protein